MEAEGLGNLIMWSAVRLSHVDILPQKPSDVRDQSCILCQVLKLGQAPAKSYTKCMKHPQAITMTPKSCWVTRREKTALFGVAPLIISAIAQQLSFEICLQVGLILWNVFQFCIFSEAVDKNVNRLLHLESVMSAMPWITWCDSPGLLPFLLHTANNQKLEL